MNRRSFVSTILLAAAAPTVVGQNLRRSRKKNTDPQATTRFIFSQAMRKATLSQLQRKPIGDVMGEIGLLFLGTPYVGGTLEGPGPETCRIDLTGLDCVTFFENVLDMARIIKKNSPTFEALVQEVTFTRYRSGTVNGYESRLHYTSEWISDNVSKGVVSDVSRELGGIIFPLEVGFMSQNPRYYPALKDNPESVERMRQIEQTINSTTRYYIPKDQIQNIESQLRTGDIIAITTSKVGLDYSHTGMIRRDEQGRARFVHASLTKKKVIIDGTISEYVEGVRSHTGISVLRPLEPKA